MTKVRSYVIEASQSNIEILHSLGIKNSYSSDINENDKTLIIEGNEFWTSFNSIAYYSEDKDYVVSNIRRVHSLYCISHMANNGSCLYGKYDLEVFQGDNGEFYLAINEERTKVTRFRGDFSKLRIKELI